jgi:hypothetical protein
METLQTSSNLIFLQTGRTGPESYEILRKVLEPVYMIEVTSLFALTLPQCALRLKRRLPNQIRTNPKHGTTFSLRLSPTPSRAEVMISPMHHHCARRSELRRLSGEQDGTFLPFFELESVCSTTAIDLRVRTARSWHRHVGPFCVSARLIADGRRAHGYDRK